MTDLDKYLSNSPTARAVLAVLRRMWEKERVALSLPALCWLLKHRSRPIPESTVQHACLELYRLNAITAVGAQVRTHKGRLAKTWRPADSKLRVG